MCTHIPTLQYKEAPELYRKTARHWAHIYAGGEHYLDTVLPIPPHVYTAPVDSSTFELEEKIKQVVMMGFSEVISLYTMHYWYTYNIFGELFRATMDGD